MKISFEHLVNRSILIFLRGGWDGSRPENANASPQIYDPALNALGAHPDVIEYFWTTLTSSLPKTCAWVLCGHPI
jgi:hypothetical protein